MLVRKLIDLTDHPHYLTWLLQSFQYSRAEPKQDVSFTLSLSISKLFYLNKEAFKRFFVASAAKKLWATYLTLFRIGGWGKKALCKISRPYLVPVPNYLAWSKTNPQKKWFFWSSPEKMEAMLTSLIKMLELNFSLCATR